MAAPTDPGISLQELRLAARNHALPLEALRSAITPIGLHYLLIHYDVPFVDPERWRLEVGGAVERPLSLTLEDVRRRPATNLTATMDAPGTAARCSSPGRSASRG